MKKMLYFIFLFGMYAEAPAAAFSRQPAHMSKIQLLFFDVSSETPLGMFSDNPVTFEHLINDQFYTKKERSYQQRLRTKFEQQLKTRPKLELWKTLVLACYNNAPTTAEYALKAGADANKRLPNSDETPLSLALQRSPVLVKVLLNNGADANLIPNKTVAQTPLYLAVYWGNRENVSSLLQHGARPNVARFDGITPLYYAAETGKVEIMKELIQAGAEIDKANNQGVTPLWMAAQEGQAEAAQLLLENKATIDHANKDGVTPLQIAALKGRLGTVNLFLSKKADHAAADYQGLTPLHQAATGLHSTIITALIAHGANRHVVTKFGETPLFIAAANDDTTSVQALLHTEQKYGAPLPGAIASINVPDRYGKNPLLIAVHNGSTAIFNLLVQAEASLDVTTTCYKKRQSLISALAESPADVTGILATCSRHLDAQRLQQLAEVQDGQGNYPMHTACARNKITVLHFLLNNNMRIDVRNAAGKTPYVLASEKGHHAIMQALIKHLVSKAVTKGVALPDITRLSID